MTALHALAKSFIVFTSGISNNTGADLRGGRSLSRQAFNAENSHPSTPDQLPLGKSAPLGHRRVLEPLGLFYYDFPSADPTVFAFSFWEPFPPLINR